MEQSLSTPHPKTVPKTVAERKHKDYVKAKKQRIKEAAQDAKNDFPNPRKGIVFPQKGFLEFNVIQDGKSIRLETYRFPPTDPTKEPKALFLLFHGLNSSVTHGSHIAKALADAGFCVVGFDHRGFGGSEGRPGFVESLDIHLQDCRDFVTKIEGIYGKTIKKFIGGLSMGGMSSFNMSLESPQRFAGAVLMAPAIQNMTSSTVVGIAKTLGKLMPKWNLLEQKGKNCHRSIAIAKDQAEDPYSYIHKMCAGTVKSIFTGMEKSTASFEQYNVPFLIIQGGLDKLVDPDVGFDLIDRSPSKDKSHLYYEEMWHDVWHEPEIVEIIPKIITWCEARI